MKCKGSENDLDPAVKMFLLDRRIAGCTEATVHAYRAQIKPFQKWVEDQSLSLDSLTDREVREFLLHRQKVSQATLHAATVRLKTDCVPEKCVTAVAG